MNDIIKRPPEQSLQGVANVPDYRKYITGHLSQLSREEKQIAKKARQARTKAEEIARQLACRYGAKKVYLFGSLATGEFDRDSDIDLAMVGLPEEQYIKAYGLAEGLARPFPVDLVFLESAVDSLRERVNKEGVVLYDGQGKKNSPAQAPGRRNQRRSAGCRTNQGKGSNSPERSKRKNGSRSR
ncbi:MAG: nucleotidyltransferase domain-containing protein [Bacillota bacterium]